MTRREEFDKYLEESGGFYTFDDIMDALRTGKMQSFAEGDTLLITQVHDFPRKRVLELAYLFGDAEGYATLEPRVEEFKNEIGADVIIASGRFGWLRKMTDGWKALSVNYVKV